MSYTPSKVPPTSSSTNSSNADISIRRVRFTTKWELIKNQRAQIVEVTLANLLPTFSLSKSTSITSNHSISVTGNGIKTLHPGSIVRLVPGDQARVDVIVTGANVSNTGKNATVEIRDKQGNVVGSFGGWEIEPLIEEWTADADVLSKHEVPTWVSNLC
jgi:alpha-L-fucosidase